MRKRLDVKSLSDAELLAFHQKRLLRKESAQESEIKKLGLFDVKKYKPYHIQEEFHRSYARIRCFLGGNYTGKTLAGAMEAYWMLTSTHPYHKWKNKDYHTHGLIIVVDHKQQCLPGGAQDKLLSCLHPDWIEHIAYERNGIVKKITMKNGNSCTFVSSEARRATIQGTRVNWIWIDEDAIPNSGYWNELNTRQPEDDSRLYIWFTMTPNLKDGHCWSSENLFPKANKANEDIRLWEASMHDNPYISEQQKKDMIENLFGDEREINARINGNWKTRRGLIFNFITEKHQVAERTIHQKKAFKAIYVVIDPHPTKPIAVCFVGVDETNNIIVWDELYQDGLVRAVADWIKAKLLGLEHLVQGYIIDWAGRGGNKIDGQSIFDEFMACGINCVNCVKDVTGGIELVKRHLYNSEVGSDDVGLYVTANCHHTIKEFRNYCWDMKTGKPQKDNDDLMDCVRYFFCDPRAKYWTASKASEPVSLFTKDGHKTYRGSREARLRRRNNHIGEGCNRNRVNIRKTS